MWFFKKKNSNLEEKIEYLERTIDWMQRTFNEIGKQQKMIANLLENFSEFKQESVQRINLLTEYVNKLETEKRIEEENNRNITRH